MPGWLKSWISDPLAGVTSALVLLIAAGVLWRQFRHRDRRRSYRQRERLRRDYWGFD